MNLKILYLEFQKLKDKFDFNTQLNLNETLLKIDFLNFEKNPKLKSQIKI